MSASDAPATASPAAAEPRTPAARVALVIACGIVIALNIGKIPPALPILRDELMLGLIAAGVVVAALNAIGALTGAGAGILVDQWGARRLLSIALLSAAAGNALGALAPSAALLVAGRLLEGLAFILVLSAAPVLLSRLAAPRDRGLVMGFWATFLPVGSTIAILAAPTILTDLGWRPLWWMLAALSLAAFAAFWAREARAIQPAGHADARFADVLAVARHPPVLFLGLAFASFSFTFISTMSFLPLWLVETGGYGVRASTAAVLALAVGNALGNVGGGALLRRGVPAWALIAVSSVSMAALVGILFIEGPPLSARIAVGGALGFISGWVPVSVFASAGPLAPRPELAGAATGCVVQILNIGTLAGPLVVSAAVAATGTWATASAVLVASSLVCLGAAFAIRKDVIALT